MTNLPGSKDYYKTMTTRVLAKDMCLSGEDRKGNTHTQE